MTTNNGISIKDSTVLTKYSASYWNRNILDSKVTKEIDENHQTFQAGKYYKNLMKGNAELINIVNIINKGYVTWRNKTMPWLDGGWRIVRSSAFMEIKSEFNDLRMQLESALKDLENVWDQRVQEDIARFKGMSSVEDYPSKSDLSKLFAMNLEAMAVPDQVDFRVVQQLSEDQRKELEEEFKKNSENRIATIKNEIREMVYEPLLRMNEICSHEIPPKQKGKKQVMPDEGKIHVADIKAIQKLAGVLPALNVFDSAELDQVTEMLSWFNKFRDADDFKNWRGNVTRREASGKIEETLEALNSALEKL